MAEYLLGDDVCPFSKRVDGPRHGWRFDGDDPYVECSWCGQLRDAQTDRIIRQGMRHSDGSECGPVGSKAPADPHTQPFEDG